MFLQSLRSGFVGMAVVLSVAQFAIGNYEARMVDYCRKNQGKRVGSGECAHLATEALRYAGAEFMRNGMPDAPVAGDYTWGTLVKEMRKAASGKVTDSRPANKCRPGDIIQYRLGAGSSKTHHTAVVAAVNSSGYPTAIFEQNFNSKRYVVRNTTDLHQRLKDRGGYLRIFRAKAPVNTSRTEFTLVNNARSGSVSYKLNGSARTIGGKDHYTGFTTIWSTGSKVTVVVGNQTYTLNKRKGYEFYLSGSTVRLRVLAM